MPRENRIPSLEEELENDLIKFKSDEPGFTYKSIGSAEELEEMMYLKDNYYALLLSIKHDLSPGVAMKLMGINNSMSLKELEEYEKLCEKLGIE